MAKFCQWTEVGKSGEKCPHRRTLLLQHVLLPSEMNLEEPSWIIKILVM